MNSRDERLPYSMAMRLRMLLCMITFILFIIMEKRMPPDVCQGIYRKLEEPMSIKALQTWVQKIQ